jgi:hypothetical protein
MVPSSDEQELHKVIREAKGKIFEIEFIDWPMAEQIFDLVLQRRRTDSTALIVALAVAIRDFTLKQYPPKPLEIVYRPKEHG